MSIIESALRRAKSAALLVEREQKPTTTDVEFSAESKADKASSTRKFPLVATDAETMERYGVLLQVSDKSTERAYKILRTRVLQRMHANKWYSCGISAAAPGEGKTLTAINLALAMAQDVNTNVFLLDLDLHRASVAKYLGMKAGLGVSDYLVGRASFDQIVYEIGVERLAVIPNFNAVEGASELLRSPRMSELLQEIKQDTPRRVALFDLPPILMSDDVLVLTKQIDSLLMVVAEGKTKRATIEELREILAEINLLGVLLNHSSEHEAASYY